MPKRNAITICILVLGIAFINVGFVRAQAILDGKLTGTITDDKGEPLGGATVEITSPSLMGKRTAITASKGTYVFLNVPVGVYRIAASLANFKTTVQDNINVTAGSSLMVNLALEIGVIEETVTVTAAGPIIDVKSSTLGSNIERAMLDKLPTSRDAFYDLSLSAPGMYDVGGAGDMPSPNAYGGTQNENVFLVNGVNTTNPRGANWGSMVQVNYNAVEEVRVVALGSKAEYGNFSGAAIDVLTKSGSNTFHGSLSFYSQLAKPKSNQPGVDADLGRDWLYVPEGADLLNQSLTDWETNATLGGPIIKDKIWFYGAFDYIRTDNKAPYWSLTQMYKSNFADAKISAEPFSSHRAWVAYHYEFNNSSGANWGAVGTDPSVTYGTRSYIHSLSAQWQWIPSSNTIFSAKYLGFWNHDELYLPDDAPAWPAYVNWWKIIEGGSIQVNGAFPWIEMFQANRQTVQADVSYYAENFLGEHDIKFGVQYTLGTGNVNDGYIFGYGNFTYPGGPSSGNIYKMRSNTSYSWYMYTDGMRFYNRQYFRNPALTVRKGTQAGVFFDDQWNPTKKLTVNLGLRFDNTKARYGEGYIYEVPATANQINGSPVVRTRAATGNIYNFNNISPRLGFTYMLDAAGKTVARAVFGRYYMPLTLEALSRFGPDLGETLNRVLWYEVPWDQVDMNNNGYVDVDENLYWTRRIRDLTPYEVIDDYVDRSWTLQVAKRLKNQYTDQLSLNLEHELLRNFSISASYIYRHTGNLSGLIPINRNTGLEWEYEMIPYTTSEGVEVELYSVVKKDYDGLGDGFTGSDVLWVLDNNNGEVRNLGTYFGKKAQRTYQALQLVLNKRFSDRWQALASAVYSWSDGLASRSVHQSFNVDASYFYDDYWPASLNNLVNNMEGPLPFTPKFEFKLSGSYTIPYVEVDLGLRFRMHTGRPIWRVDNINRVASQWMAEVPADYIVLPNASPLGVNLIASDPKKPDYLPPQSILDFRLEKAFKLGSYGNFHLVLDIFNVFNVATIIDAEPGVYNYGMVNGFVPPRKVRFSLLFEF